ncbi:MAG: metallophosphatase, partial [Pseudomonadota bacterium]
RHGNSQPWNPHSYGVGQSAEGVNDGQEMWDELIAQRGKVLAVLCGHVLNDGLGYAISQGAGPVHQILANYQMNTDGGEGFLRIVRFNPTARRVDVLTYSPWLDTYKTDPANFFSFSYSY